MRVDSPAREAHVSGPQAEARKLNERQTTQ
jgi:hypothetical protein